MCEGMLIRVRGEMNKFVNTAKNASRRPRTARGKLPVLLWDRAFA